MKLVATLEDIDLSQSDRSSCGISSEYDPSMNMIIVQGF